MPDPSAIPTHIFQEIIEAGIRAPSADNSQPWLFSVKGDAIELWLDETHTGLFFDADMAATFIGCGAVIENMVLETARHKLVPEVDCASEVGPERPVASLKIRMAPTRVDDLAPFVAERGTHRGLYGRRTAVTEQELDRIESANRPTPGSRVLWCRSDDARRQIMKAAFGADLIRYTHPIIHQDFHTMLRFGSSVEKLRDGLADDTLGIESFLLPFLRLLSPWPLARILNCVGMHYFMAWRGCWLPMQTAPVLGVLVCDRETSYLQMGRALQRVWLAATASGLAFQPLGALPLLLVRLHKMKGEGLSKEHIARLHRLDQQWRSACGNSDDGDRLVMIFRIGHTAKSPARARRRALASFLRTGVTKTS